jgi:membrane-associated phospholipid phosphatase
MARPGCCAENDGFRIELVGLKGHSADMPRDLGSNVLGFQSGLPLLRCHQGRCKQWAGLREGFNHLGPMNKELAAPTSKVAPVVSETIAKLSRDWNPASPRAGWWLLALALWLAVPTAFAQQNQAVPDRAPYSDKPEPPADSAKGFVKDIAVDQKQIWTSPFRMTRDNAKWWLIFGAATGALIVTDRRSAQLLPNTGDQMAVSRHSSQLGAVYTLVPIAGGMYLGGVLSHKPKLRETGFRGAEALVGCLIVSEVLKVATGRQRPMEGDGGGHFFHGGDGFPSGHSIESFALASVIAHQYHDKKAVVVLAYGLATAIGVSRFTSREHFASDVVAGGAMGWFIGRYVSERHREGRRSPAKAWLTPEVIPQFHPADRRYGLLLAWHP